MTRSVKAVALGGGHGLYATLLALRAITEDITAVVTVADDGGSSGRLRRELGMLAPGDL
ncbi:MAG TPA: 2-phospho-L-lactate transferase CofD family protein, partial [Pseudonocardiaceae bacterium]|nr:2-phospho-L-lactate transferase CofD family protein [Pseudonocardiaceae bacterium]